jgi:hypothetical protein
VAKRKRVLTELEWERVHELRCRSKRGQPLTDEEQALVTAAHASDGRRYRAGAASVFDETAEAIGSPARARHS